jgi:hypothetical protein
MVKITEYHPGEFMVNTTKEEALRLIKSLATQLANDDCNKDRTEFVKRHEDDVTYFSIAVDESVTKFHVMTNLINDCKVNDMVLGRYDTLGEAKEFMVEFEDKGLMKDSQLWIKEVGK